MLNKLVKVLALTQAVRYGEKALLGVALSRHYAAPRKI